MKGLAPHTLQVFEAVSKLDCIKSYLLVGGTALSLQMGTRQSEDLDFMKWRTSKTEKMEVAWYQIVKQQLYIRSKSTKNNRFISGGSANKKGCIPLGISLLACGPAWA